jgi:MFS family permease
MLIAMPDIFRGIKLDPLEPGNSTYLLWLILGYLVTSSVLVVSVGRLGDLFGRVRMYNLGFAIYTFASLALTVDWMTGHAGAIWLLVWRIVQGVGGAFLVGNSGAILTDAFPAHQRGLALGINNVAGISGTFIGLVLGGLLAPINWRLVFLISVPCGVFGGLWAWRKLRDVVTSAPDRASRSTGWAMRRSRWGWSWSWSASPTGFSPTAGTPWAGPARWYSARWPAARCCWSASRWSSPRSATRCSGWRCSASGRLPSARSPHSCPRSGGAA